MDRIFNFFSKPKSKEDLEKNKKHPVINTQNLQTFSNINQTAINKENQNIEYIINQEIIKTQDNNSQEFEHTSKINDKFENNVKAIINKIEQKSENINNSVINFEKAKNYDIEGPEKNINLILNDMNKINFKSGDVVIVNTLDDIKKSPDGYYTKKYSEQITNLKSVIKLKLNNFIYIILVKPYSNRERTYESKF